MNIVKILMGALCLAAAAAATLPAAAQRSDAPPPGDSAPQAAAKTSAQAEAGEPRAATSSIASQNRAAPPAPATPTAEAASQTQPGSQTAGSSASTGRISAVSAKKAPAGNDRLSLSTATVTGDREQPKVMYIVPWKKSDMGDLAGKPMNSLVDEILAPVDRDVFKREVYYYQAVKSDGSQSGAKP